jgi:hypothetical protein
MRSKTLRRFWSLRADELPEGNRREGGPDLRRDHVGELAARCRVRGKRPKVLQGVRDFPHREVVHDHVLLVLGEELGLLRLEHLEARVKAAHALHERNLGPQPRFGDHGHRISELSHDRGLGDVHHEKRHHEEHQDDERRRNHDPKGILHFVAHSPACV